MSVTSVKAIQNFITPKTTNFSVGKLVDGPGVGVRRSDEDFCRGPLVRLIYWQIAYIYLVSDYYKTKILWNARPRLWGRV